MGDEAGFALQTERLLLREAEVEDLVDIHRVFASDPELAGLRPAISAAGGYDLAAVRQYWEGAQLDARRHVLVSEESSSGEIVGIVDFVSESPADGMSWIGLVLICRDRRRHGLGSEAVGAVAEHLAASGHHALRMAVLEGNDAGLAFAHQLGFEWLADFPTWATDRRAIALQLDLPPHVRHGSG